MTTTLISFRGWSPGAIATACHALNDHGNEYLGEEIAPSIAW